MSQPIDRTALIKKIQRLEGLTREEKSSLVELLHQKKYGLVWEEKTENVEERMREQLPILEEVKEKAIKSEAPDAPNHVLIEGDNLEALTVLSYTHEGKIDVIYIDPPYNTGNKDFIYNDSFVDTEDSYRHSKWLSFMSKRLKIAKRLLSEKGVIFISIDDNEQAQLKLLCDEIFKNFDFLATIPWRKRTAKTDVPHSLSQDYEWILCYAAHNFKAGIKKESRKYYNTDDFPGKPWRVHDMSTQRTAEERPNSNFTIVNPKNGEQYPVNPLAVWRITKEGFPQYIKENRIVFPGDYGFLHISKPVLRYWKEDDEKKAGETFGFTAVSSDLPKEVGMTQNGTKDVTDIFGDKAFGFPKPMALIKYLLKIATPIAKRITILDFFAGSGTTLHATMQLNSEDGGHRQCILVTNNENGICEQVTYERNKRVICGYTTPKGQDVAGLSNNNLRYYRTALLPRTRTLRNMRALVSAATDMLCIKEDLYEEQNIFGNLVLQKELVRYFCDGRKHILMVYEETLASQLSQAISKMEFDGNRLKIYIFSPERYAFDDEFWEVEDKVQLVALPAAIYDAYKRVLPHRADQPLDPPEEVKKFPHSLFETTEDAEDFN